MIRSVQLPEATSGFMEKPVLQTFEKWPVTVIVIDIYFLKQINLWGCHAVLFNVVWEEGSLWRSEDAFMLVVELFMTPIWGHFAGFEITLLVKVV